MLRQIMYKNPVWKPRQLNLQFLQNLMNFQKTIDKPMKPVMVIYLSIYLSIYAIRRIHGCCWDAAL
ncbi:hypothetical protein FACS1894216_14460 [Synergistales bacterium]|nr:hypothetical protein FACS1894216_14460 [Synergistales bacterium]